MKFDAGFLCVSVPLWLVFLLGLFLLGVFFLRLLGALGFLHLEFASEKFDDRQISAVAFPVTEFDDAAVTAIAIRETRCDGFEYLLCNRLAQQKGLQLAAGMKIVPLAQSNHLLGKRPHFLGLGQRSHQTAMIEQVRDEIPQHRATMRRVAAELTMGVPMSHTVCSEGAWLTGLP
jgi:hypothetical protein